MTNYDLLLTPHGTGKDYLECFQNFIKNCDQYVEQILKAKEEAKDVNETAVDNTIAQIIEKEELSDDLELVAVIAAAIAASEGAASTDGFVVRSIRKVRR